MRGSTCDNLKDMMAYSRYQTYKKNFPSATDLYSAVPKYANNIIK